MQPGKPQRNVNAPSVITKSGFSVKENFKSKESFAISNLRNSKMLLWVLKHYAIVRPEFFYFSFYRPSRPNFLEIEKKNKRDFFQFYFFISLRLMPVQYWSSVMFFRFVFSIAARLIKLPPVTAPGEILPF